jgi:hypothetical protein
MTDLAITYLCGVISGLIIAVIFVMFRAIVAKTAPFNNQGPHHTTTLVPTTDAHSSLEEIGNGDGAVLLLMRARKSLGMAKTKEARLICEAIDDHLLHQ